MSDVPFHATRMGQKFYEHTLPRLVEQLERIAAALEKLAERDGDEGVSGDETETGCL